MGSTCKTCSQPGAVTCLGCGYAFCALHRGEQNGVPTCKACLEEERARRERAAARQRKQAERAQQAEARRLGGDAEGGDAEAPDRPLPPLPEPPGNGPLLWGLKAALPAALYFWFFLGWLGKTHELPGWVQPAGTLAGAAVAFAGVWAIAKTRASSTGGP